MVGSLPVKREMADRNSAMLFPEFVRQGRNRTKYKAGYIDRQGRVVVEPIYESAYPFREGLGSVRVGKLWAALDVYGAVAIQPISETALVFVEGLSEFRLNGKDGVLDRHGNVIVSPRYRSVSHFSGGVACVADGSLYGFINRQGYQVIPPFFDDARPFSEGASGATSHLVAHRVSSPNSIAATLVGRVHSDRGLRG
jgi:hypothetical protein